MIQWKGRWIVIKLTALILALLPILAQYQIRNSILSIGDLFLLTISSLWFLLKFKKNAVVYKKKNRYIYLFLIYIILNSLFFIIYYSSKQAFSEIIPRSLRFSFYTIVATIILPDLINFKIYLKYHTIIAYIASLFIIFQTIVYKLTGFFIFGFYEPLIDSSRHGLQYKYLNNYESLLRPSSFFIEPGYFARYIIIALFFLVFDKKKSNKSNVVMLVLIIGIILSTSGQGYISLIILFVLYIRENKQNNLFTLSFCIMILILLIYSSGNNINLMTLETIMDRNFLSLESRFNASFVKYDIQLNLTAIFGVGYGFANTFYNMGNYYSSIEPYQNTIAYLFANIGAFGVILYLFAIFNIDSKNKYVTYFSLLYFIMLFGSSVGLYIWSINYVYVIHKGGITYET